MNSSTWSIEQAAALYALPHWGKDYFTINDLGHVCVRPSTTYETAIDLFEIACALREQHFSWPVLLRFPDILRDRIHKLQQAFADSCRQHHYEGIYTPVYPIKVNQQGTVLENIVTADNIGLEAGSKPELLAILGLSRHDSLIICNGYKDRAYVRMALIGLQMGQTVYIVIEKPSELDIILTESEQMGVRPELGIRVRLSTLSSGKWQNSGGEKSKFGLHACEVLQLIERLKQTGRLDCLRLMHFHMGSQIANIHDIKLALQEASQFFLQLVRLGVNISVVDAGGGLGVDYDGSASRRDCSINYSLREYAENIVSCFARVCRENRLPQPALVTESGRAITAHHAVLITDVTDVESLRDDSPHQPMALSGKNIVETYHNIQFDMSEARALFIRGDISLAELAAAERRFIDACFDIRARLNPDNHHQREILHELDEKLANKVFCNFSLFQSMPDIWGIDQIFPIMPIHRLTEQPQRRAVLQDLTCDSDGRIDLYVDSQNIEKTLPVHVIDRQQPYLIGFFMLGAYQEILGDMHNLFGDTHSLNIELDGNGYRISDILKGEQVTDMLNYVHIDIDHLKRIYASKLRRNDLASEMRVSYLQELNAGLQAYTYLEK